MLSLINQSTTPYILIATEDRMFHRTDKEEFMRVMKDVIDNKVQYMPIGKLDHLTVGSRYSTVAELLKPTQVHFKTCVKKYRDSGKELFLFKAQDAPVKITSFSADALYRREFLISLLENVISKYGHSSKSPRGFGQNTSKYFEDCCSDDNNGGVRTYGEMLCAVPKKEIVVSDETPGESLGTLSETPKDILEFDIRKT